MKELHACSLLLQGPDLECIVFAARHRVAIHVSKPLGRRRVAIKRERSVLQGCTIKHLELVLARRRHDLTAVELQRRDGVVVADRVGDGSGAQVPDANRLVEAARDDVRLVELQARHRTGVPKERAVRLPGAHVPHAHGAVAAAAGQGVAPELHAAHKVLVHFPAAV